MLAEIENRLKLEHIYCFTLEECEDQIMLLHYL